MGGASISIIVVSGWKGTTPLPFHLYSQSWAVGFFSSSSGLRLDQPSPSSLPLLSWLEWMLSPWGPMTLLFISWHGAHSEY